jgi:PAS domain S-box-containing protein
VDLDIKVRVMQQTFIDNQQKHSDLNNVERAVGVSTIPEIDILFHDASKKFPYSVTLLLSWSVHAFSLKSNRFLAMAKLRKVFQFGPNQVQIIAAETRLRYVADASITGEKEDDIVGYMEQQKIESELTTKMIQNIASQMLFWKIFMTDPQALLQCMKDLSSTFDDSLKSSTEMISKLLNMNPASPYYRRLYGQFLLNIVGDEEGSSAQFGKALELEAEGTAARNEDIADINNGVIIMSGEEENRGCILQVNNKAARLLGHSPAELVGKSVSVLMPDGYGVMHNTHLANYVETRISRIMNTKRYMMFKHGKGHILEAELMVREFANFGNLPSIAYLGVIYPTERERIFCMVEVSSLLVTDVSLPFMKMFDVDMEAILTKKILMEKYIPQFSAMALVCIEALQANQVHTLSVTKHTATHRSPFLLTIRYAPYSQDNYFYVEVEAGKIGRKMVNVDHQFADHKKGIEDLNSTLKKKVKENKRLYGSTEASMASINSTGSGSFRRLQKGDHRSSRESRDSSRVLSNSRRGSTFSDKSALKQSHGSMNHFASLASNNAFTVPGPGQNVIEPTERPSEESLISNQSFTTLVIRKAIEVQRKQADPYYRAKLISISTTVAVICLLAIFVQLLWRSIVFDTVERDLHLLENMESLPWVVKSGEYNFQVIKLINNGVLPNEPHSQLVKRDLAFSISLVDKFKQEMSSYSIKLNGNTLDLLLSQNVSLTTTNGQIQSMNVLDSLYLYSTFSTILLQADWKEIMAKQPEVFEFYVTNSGSKLVETIFQATNSFQLNQANLNIVLNIVSIIILAVSLTINAFLFAGLLLPTIRRSELQKISISNVFAGIPKDKLRQALADASEKFRRLISQEEAYTDAVEKANRTSMKKMMEQNNLEKNYAASYETAEFNILKLFSNFNTFRISLIIVLVAGYYLFVYLQFNAMREMYLDDLSARLNNAGVRQKIVKELTMEFLDWDGDSQFFVANSNNIKALEDELWNIEFAVVYGDQTLNVKNDLTVLMSAEQDLYTGLCPFIHDVNQTECSQYRNKLLGNGVHELVLNFISFSEFIRTNAPPVSDTHVGVPYENVLAIKEMADVYLQQALFHSSIGLINNYRQMFDSFSFQFTVVTTLFILSSICSLILYYRPLIQHLEHDLKRTRAMILIIPPSVLENSSSVRKEVKVMAEVLANSRK